MLTACLRSFNPHPLRHSLKILDTELRAKNIFNSELDNFVTRSHESGAERSWQYGGHSNW